MFLVVGPDDGQSQEKIVSENTCDFDCNVLKVVFLIISCNVCIRSYLCLNSAREGMRSCNVLDSVHHLTFVQCSTEWSYLLLS